MIIMLTAVVVYNVIILQTHASLLDEYSRFLYRTESLDRYVKSGKRVQFMNWVEEDI